LPDTSLTPIKPLTTLPAGARRFSVAPMMDWSDRHCRYLWRLVSKQTLLYSEMVTTGALIHGDASRFLQFNSEEQPVALQLGGSDPTDLASCARMAEKWGYNEVNLNCGCPSDRVQNGMIGAILMKHPTRVADCMKSMQDAVSIDVTIKHRIGVDDMEDYAGLVDFVGTIADTGCRTFVVHARKAWLQGLSPKQNREVPPLQYEMVYDLKRQFPELEIILNGGLHSMAQCKDQLPHLDGVMVGREAYSNPYLLAAVDHEIYGAACEAPSRLEVAEQFMAYCQQQIDNGLKLKYMSRHMLGLFQGEYGARAFRRYISENAYKEGAGIEVLEQALKLTEKPITAY